MPFKELGDLRKYQRRYQREWVRKRRLEFFSGKSCAHCGSLEKLELDHIDPATKISNSIWGWEKVRREQEISKCQVLCAPCHLKKTSADRAARIPAHGLTQYKKGCRCLICKQISSEYKAAYRKKTGRH